MTSNLKRRTAQGSIYMAAATFGNRVIGMFAVIFLARILDPNDFGMVALAMVLFSTTRLFSGMGMSAAVIHSKLDVKVIAFQAFTLTLITSSVLFIIVYNSPYFFADLLGDEEIVSILRWLSLLIFTNGLSLIPLALLRKSLNFRMVSISLVVSELIYYAAALLLAKNDFGVWSLVYANLLSSSSRVLIIWFSHPRFEWLIPKRWDWGVMRELVRYGIQSTGSGFMSYFNSNWDDWLVGRFIGSTFLGFYSKAYNLTNQTIVGFNRSVISGVLFPSYATVQNDKKLITRFYLKSLGVVSLIMTPLSMGLFVIAEEFVPVFLGDKWLPMVPVLQIFAFMALVRPLAGSTSPLFQAVGKPNFNLHIGLFITATMAPLILILISRGIEGVALAVTISYVLAFLFSIYNVSRILPKAATRMLPTIFPSAIAGLTMIAAV
jgi:O-antigen/teichoic acid export membrane protein